MRTFIAVELPETVKSLIAQAQAPLKGHGADVSWVRPANIHVTLKFLGEVTESKVKEVFTATEKALQGVRRFTMSLAGMGVFPGANRARVLWIGAGRGVEPLADLAERIETAMLEIGFPREKRLFTPHFTIGRVKSPRNLGPVLDLVKDSSFATSEFPVTEVVVMKSDLQPSGAIYTPMKRVELS